MQTLVIDVKSLEDGLREDAAVWNTGIGDPAPRISFVTYELMHNILAPNRVAVILAMTGAGPLSIREVARRVGRDFKGVHTDVTALLKNGLLEKTADGLVVFPYDRIHFDFEIGAADQSAA